MSATPPHTQISPAFADIQQLANSIPPLNYEAADKARERQQQLTKPLGALGQLEDLSIQLAAILGSEFPKPRGAAVIVAAADHGVSAEGVSAYPNAVTAAMVANFLADTPHGQGGAAVNALARSLGVQVYLADTGVAHDLPQHSSLGRYAVRKSTRNFVKEAAMTATELNQMVMSGAAAAKEAIQHDADIIVAGEMGIANTSAAAAMTARLLNKDAAEVVGRGTGISDQMLEHKINVITQALSRSEAKHPLEVLCEYGGYEIAFMLGVMLKTAASSKVVVLDGFVEGAAALVAKQLNQNFSDYVVVAGRCAEKGHNAQLAALGKQPHFDLGLRLGEGTGGVLMVPWIMAAAASLREMQTFAEAGVPSAN